MTTRFSLDPSDTGDSSSHMEGQSVNGGTHEGGRRRYEGGPNFDRLYHKLKVLLLLLLLLCY